MGGPDGPCGQLSLRGPALLRAASRSRLEGWHHPEGEHGAGGSVRPADSRGLPARADRYHFPLLRSARLCLRQEPGQVQGRSDSRSLLRDACSRPWTSSGRSRPRSESDFRAPEPTCPRARRMSMPSPASSPLPGCSSAGSPPAGRAWRSSPTWPSCARRSARSATHTPCP